MAKELEKLDFVVKVYLSDSNFLLVRLKQLSKEIYKYIADNGIVVRFRGNDLHYDECLRITIGTAEESKDFLALLEKTSYQLSSAAAAAN